jgi:hypothetical protein
MTKDVTLREMIEAMSAYADDDTFRWFTVDAACTVRVTMGQARKELAAELCCECGTALDGGHSCPNENCCEWKGLCDVQVH